MTTLINNLVIIFFPGTGGHHLANLLSITGRYQYTVDYSRYFVSGEDSKHAHYQDDSAESSVYLSHFGSIDDSQIEKISGPNTQFLVIHFPINNELAWRRIETNKWPSIENNKLRDYFHFKYDLEKIYKQQYLEKLYPGKWATVMADDLFSDNTNLLFDKLESAVGAQFLDRDLANRIHTAWIKNIKEYISLIDTQ